MFTHAKKGNFFCFRCAGQFGINVVFNANRRQVSGEGFEDKTCTFMECSGCLGLEGQSLGSCSPGEVSPGLSLHQFRHHRPNRNWLNSHTCPLHWWWWLEPRWIWCLQNPWGEKNPPVVPSQVDFLAQAACFPSHWAGCCGCTGYNICWHRICSCEPGCVKPLVWRGKHWRRYFGTDLSRHRVWLGRLVYSGLCSGFSVPGFQWMNSFRLRQRRIPSEDGKAWFFLHQAQCRVPQAGAGKTHGFRFPRHQPRRPVPRQNRRWLSWNEVSSSPEQKWCDLPVSASVRPAQYNDGMRSLPMPCLVIQSKIQSILCERQERKENRSIRHKKES